MIGCVWYNAFYNHANLTPLLNIYRNVCVVMYSHNWSKKRTCSMPVHKEGNELCIIYTSAAHYRGTLDVAVLE